MCLSPLLLQVMGRTVITRSGNPLRVSDMQKVAAGYAGTVVVLSPDVEQVKRLCGNVWGKCGVPRAGRESARHAGTVFVLSPDIQQVKQMCGKYGERKRGHV